MVRGRTISAAIAASIYIASIVLRISPFFFSANKMEISENIKRHAVNYMHDVITSGIAAGKQRAQHDHQ